MTNYRHPKNNPDSCPCNITKYDDCRNADDIEVISFDKLTDYAPSELIVLPSGQCITKDNLSLMETWKDPFTNKELSFDNEFCDMSEACVRDRDRDQARDQARDRDRGQAQWQAIIEEHQRLAARPEMQERFRNRQIQQEEEDLQEQRLQLYQNGVELIMGIIFTILGIAGQSARNIIRNFVAFLRFLYGLGYQGGLTLAAVIYIQLLIDPNVIVIGAVAAQPILTIFQRIVAIMNFFGQNGGTSLSTVYKKKHTSNNNTIKTTQETVVNNLTENIEMKPEKVVKNLTTNIDKILKLITKTNDKKSMAFITSIKELKSIINDTQFGKTLNYKETKYSSKEIYIILNGISGTRKSSSGTRKSSSGTRKSSSGTQKSSSGSGSGRKRKSKRKYKTI
jgi:uncharacterized membrane protein YgcG